MLRDEIEVQRQRVRDAVQRWLKLSNTAELKRDFETQLNDANFRLRKFEEHGVADKLQKRLGFQQDATALARMMERADSFILALGSLIAEHEDELRNATSYVSKQNPDFFTAYYAEFSSLVAKVDQLKQIERDARTSLQLASRPNRASLKAQAEPSGGVRTSRAPTGSGPQSKPA